MEYNKLIAVTGLPGLFELIASKNDGAIVRSLDDKTTKFVSSRVHSFSHLETIEVYTNQENVNLATVFQTMKADKTALPDIKDGAAIKKYFEKVYPEMDFERVFASDMKKMVRWFQILDQNKVEIKLSEIAEEEVTGQSEEAAAGEKPVAEKKKPAKKAEEEKTDAKKAPAKKTAAKKTGGAMKDAGTARDEAAPKKSAAPKEPKSAASKSGKAEEAPKKKAGGRKKAED